MLEGPDPEEDAAPEQGWAALAAARGLWGWGDADGLTPWTDAEGRAVVPLWTTAERAAAESREGAEPGEEPLFLDLDALLAEIPDWLTNGVAEAGLDPDGGRFVLTVPLADLSRGPSGLPKTGVTQMSIWAVVKSTSAGIHSSGRSRTRIGRTYRRAAGRASASRRNRARNVPPAADAPFSVGADDGRAGRS